MGRDNGAQVQAGQWLALNGSCSLVLIDIASALAGFGFVDGSRWLLVLLVWCLRQDGRKGSASNGAAPGPMAAPSDGLGWARSIPKGGATGATAGDGMAEPP